MLPTAAHCRRALATVPQHKASTDVLTSRKAPTCFSGPHSRRASSPRKSKETFSVGNSFKTHALLFSGASPAPTTGISWCDTSRADVALQLLFPETFPTTSRAKKYCRHHRVFVDGTRACTTSTISPGQHVMVLGRKLHPPNPLLEAVTVLHDDDDLCVLVKPEGVFTHGHGRGRTRKSMTHVIERIVAASAAGDRLPKPGPAHRLDKATGGIVTFVKTLRAAQQMQNSFATDRSVYKRYRALVTGAVQGDAGLLDAPLNGKECLTKFSVVERRFEEHIDKWVTLLDLEPLTGRQHQLRKHLAMAGHPIVGDPWYCQLPEVKDGDIFEGWMLHGLYLFACELHFRHPIHANHLSFCVEPPSKFERPVGKVKKKKRRQQRQEQLLLEQQEALQHHAQVEGGGCGGHHSP